jgi:NTE family protein/lysophospholipid hydrolase
MGDPNIEIIKKFDFFENISISQSEMIADKLEIIEYRAGEVIFEKDSEENAGIYFLIDGVVHFLKENGNDVFIDFSSGDFLSTFYSDDEKDDFTAVASSNIKVAFIDKESILILCEDNIELEKTIYDLLTKGHNLLKLYTIFISLYGDNIDYKGFDEISSAGEWLEMPDNSKLFEIGDASDYIYYLVSGLLKAFTPIKNKLKMVGEIYEGEVIGEMGILSDDPRSASIYATRPSLVFKLSKSHTTRLMIKYPQVILQFANKIADRLRSTQTTVDNSSLRIDIYSLVSLSMGEKQELDHINIGKSLNNSITKIRPCYFLSSALVCELLNIRNINKKLSSIEKYTPLEDLLVKLCANHRYLILSCDMEYSPWTSWCLSISETDLYLVDPAVGINNEDIIYQIKRDEKSVPNHLQNEKQLIIYHKSKDDIPEKTSDYFNAITPVNKHYHIALEDSKDIDRVARTIIGKSIGLCLAGGGAKGNAHIGVYKALIENNIPIDTVCGTSAGGIVASLIASGYSPIEIIEMLKVSNSKNIFKEYTIPYSSIIATNKVVDDAKILSGNRNIEDLWLPLFTCAVNISTSELVVLDRGPIWKATRATAALPGILLPFIQGDSLLVDGGLINNMPGDILLNRYGGKLISVSVNTEKDLFAQFDKFPPQASYFIKKLLFKKKKEDVDIPNLIDILMRSIMVSSAAKSLEVEKMSDIFLNPKVDGIGMLEFDSIDESVEIGYNYTMKKLEEIDINVLYK